ncbi:MAG: hypothetical protein RL596_1112 [Bacteroidota bacterium]
MQVGNLMRSYLLYKLLLSCLLLVVMQTNAQRCAVNIDFELGSLFNWTCDTGRIRSDGVSSTLSQSGPIGGRHEIISNGNTALDPYGKFPLTCPNGSGYSLQLGNSSTGAQTEQISYVFTIPQNANIYSLVYWYAVVFQNPGHSPNEQPRFTVEVLDLTTNSPIDCGSFSYVVSANLPGFEESTTSRTVMYKKWTPVTVNLSRLAGHTIQLKFSTADCTRGGHFGYAYVDVDTDCDGPLKGAGYCRGDDSLVLKAPYGFHKYAWYKNNFTELLGVESTLKFTPAPIAGSEYAVVLEPYPGYGCADTLRTIVKEGYIPPFSFTKKQVCEKDSIMLTAGFNNSQFRYQWMPNIGLGTPDEFASNASPPQDQTYKLKIVDTASGCTKESSIDVEVIKMNIAVEIRGDTLICGNRPFTAQLKVDSSFSIRWLKNGNSIPGISDFVLTPSSIGFYSAMLSKSQCNFYTRNIEIKHRPLPNIGFSINTVAQCLTNNRISVTANSPGLFPVQYNWIWGDGKLGKDSITSYSYTIPGNYYITQIVKSADGCIDSTSKSIRIFTPPISDFSVNSPCVNSTTQLTNTSIIANGDIPIYTWMVAGNRSNTLNASNTYTRQGLYPVTLKTITDKCADTVSVTKYITILNAPPAKKNMIRAASGINTKLSTVNSGIKFSWLPTNFISNNDVAEPIYNGSTAMRYLATITTANDCTITDTVDVQLFSKISIFVPTGFSPNGDGKNDRLSPILIGIAELNYFRIWNRWGQLVFEAKTAKPGWDGTVAGIPQLTGTFIWEISATDGTGKPVREKGLVTILR